MNIKTVAFYGTQHPPTSATIPLPESLPLCGKTYRKHGFLSHFLVPLPAHGSIPVRLRPLTASLFMLAALLTCRSLDDRIHDLSSYTWDPSLPLSSRVTMPPPFILRYLSRLDRRNAYIPARLREDELRIVHRAFTFVPPAFANVLRRRLIAVYFIEDFASAGLTEWVKGPDGSLYSFMVFDRSSLSKSASDILTSREKTCFIPSDPGMTVRLRIRPDMPGFYYILLHEAAHAADYACRYTPYVEPATAVSNDPTPLTAGVWAEYRRPIKSFPFADRIHFYGNPPAVIPVSMAPVVYRKLAATPFPTLYAAQSWAEDAAELAFFCNAHARGFEYTIEIVKHGKLIDSYAPMRRNAVKQRCKIALEVFDACDDMH